jgi:hypothetical protein
MEHWRVPSFHMGEWGACCAVLCKIYHREKCGCGEQNLIGGIIDFSASQNSPRTTPPPFLHTHHVQRQANPRVSTG